MSVSIKILWEGGFGEYEDRKSRFLADVTPCDSEEEALAFIEKIRKKYWDARHHCYAYVIGDRGQIQRCSDDGEPSQTAGRPMLDVILGAEVKNICIVVTRYFGGTLLGTGGLVRAYSTAAQEGLKNSRIIDKLPGQCLHIETDYNAIGKILYLLEKQKLKPLESEYTDHVSLSVMVPSDQVASLLKDITESTNGKAGLTLDDETYYSIIDGELITY